VRHDNRPEAAVASAPRQHLAARRHLPGAAHSDRGRANKLERMRLWRHPHYGLVSPSLLRILLKMKKGQL
jgi:hypothetical protein